MEISTRPSFSIYDASAGSGKTYELVKQYLRIILTASRDDAYRNILAITFTNKAVHEMKSRIVGSLSEFANPERSDKSLRLMQDLAADTGLSVDAIQKKARQIIRHLIHNYAAFDISTIDKFTHRVIRTFAHDLNLPVSFEVSLDTDHLLMEAVDALIAQAGEDPELTKLLVDFTMEKTDDDKSWDISREILETGKLALNENNRNEIAHFREKSIAEFVAIKNKLSEAAAALEEQNKQLGKLALEYLDQNGIDPKSFSRGTFPNHLSCIRDGILKPTHKRFYEPEDIAINKNAANRAQIERLIPDWLAMLQTVYRNGEKRDFYRAFLRNITPLSLLNTVNQELDKIQQEQNILSIAAFNAIIHREIQGQPAPFIYERLGERYRHFFIDEFQDTSEMQWQNLVPLIDNALAGQDDSGQKGTLMIVGDPKQSIYRWRGGKAEQFIGLGRDEESANPFSNKERKKISLKKNWRSYSEVIAFNNAFFAMLAGEFEHPDYRELYEKYSYQESNDKTGGYVSLQFIAPREDTQDEESADQISRYLTATHQTIEAVRARGFRYADIAILTRKRGQGVAIAKFLTEQNIPLLSSETLMIANANEVRLIVHLLRYLRNAADLESKAFFLQGISARVAPGMPMHDFIAAGMGHTLELQFELWLQQFEIRLSFQDIRKKALYEAVEEIVSMFIAEPNNAYVQYFLDIVLEREMRGQAGVADFLDFWDKSGESFSIPSPEGKDAVRIMTIHKSKGLEFPVVIFPFADEDYSRKPKDKLWVDADQEFGLEKVLVDNNSAVADFGPGAAGIFLQKKQEELLDNINVLYVALTRAEEQLYIISDKNLTSRGEIRSNTMSAFFIRFLETRGLYEPSRFHYSFGDPAKLSAADDPFGPEQIIPVVAQKLDPGNIRIAAREAVMWGTHQQQAIGYGNSIHELLSYVKTPSDVSLAVEKGVESGLITVLQQAAVRQVIDDIVTHPELGPFFAPGVRVLNEQAIVQPGHGIIKPDRMVLTGDGSVLLLDYKTGAPERKHQLQLENYGQAIESMGYRVTKKALVYTGETLKIIHL